MALPSSNMAKTRKSNLARNSSRAHDTRIVRSHESEEETQIRLILNTERHTVHRAAEKTRGQRRSRRFFDGSSKIASAERLMVFLTFSRAKQRRGTASVYI